MNGFSRNTNLYDDVGYLLVGFYQLLSIAVAVHFYTDSYYLDSVSLQSSIVLVLVTYLIGHVLQAISNIFVKEYKDELTGFDYVYERARKVFKLPKKLNNNNVFQYCYIYALSHDESGHIKLFNALYSLYRGLYTVSLMNTILLTGFVLAISVQKIPFSLHLIPLFIVNMLLTYLFGSRRKRFYRYLGVKVLVTADISFRERR